MKSNNEFTRLRKDRGGGCRPSFFTVLGAVLALAAFIWACYNKPDFVHVMPVYASSGFIRPPSGTEEMDGFMVYSETYNVGNSVFSYAPDNMQFHYTIKKNKPAWFVNAPTTTYNLRADYISYHAVDYYGTKLWYRLILYDVSGNEVFRSGLMRSDDKVNVRGINFYSYDVYIINLDDDGNVIQANQTGPQIRHTFGYIYYAPLPTEPQGQEEYIETTDYIDMSDFEDVTMPEWDFRENDEAAGYLTFAAFCGNVWRLVLGMRWIGFLFTTCIMISLVIYVMRL